jgi:hypothetical protein
MTHPQGDNQRSAEAAKHLRRRPKRLGRARKRYAVWTMYGSDDAGFEEAVYFVDAMNESAATTAVELAYAGATVLSVRSPNELRQLATRLETETVDIAAA